MAFSLSNLVFFGLLFAGLSRADCSLRAGFLLTSISCDSIREVGLDKFVTVSFSVLHMEVLVDNQTGRQKVLDKYQEPVNYVSQEVEYTSMLPAACFSSSIFEVRERIVDPNSPAPYREKLVFQKSQKLEKSKVVWLVWLGGYKITDSLYKAELENVSCTERLPRFRLEDVSIQHKLSGGLNAQAEELSLVISFLTKDVRKLPLLESISDDSSVETNLKANVKEKLAVGELPKKQGEEKIEVLHLKNTEPPLVEEVSRIESPSPDNQFRHRPRKAFYFPKGKENALEILSKVDELNRSISDLELSQISHENPLDESEQFMMSSILESLKDDASNFEEIRNKQPRMAIFENRNPLQKVLEDSDEGEENESIDLENRSTDSFGEKKSRGQKSVGYIEGFDYNGDFAEKEKQSAHITKVQDNNRESQRKYSENATDVDGKESPWSRSKKFGSSEKEERKSAPKQLGYIEGFDYNGDIAEKEMQEAAILKAKENGSRISGVRKYSNAEENDEGQRNEIQEKPKGILKKRTEKIVLV